MPKTGTRPTSRKQAASPPPDRELSTGAVRLIDALVAHIHAFRREVRPGRFLYLGLMTALLYPASRLLHESGHLLIGFLLGAEVEGVHIGGSWPLDFPVVLASRKIAILDMYLRVEPNPLSGAYLRWDTREVWWGLRPLLAAAGPVVTFWVGHLAWKGYAADNHRRWLFVLYAVNLAMLVFGFLVPISGTDGYQFWRMVLRRE